MIVDEHILKERQKEFENWKWKVMSPKERHGYLLQIALEVNTLITGERFSNGEFALSFAGCVTGYDGSDISPTHLGLLRHPSYKHANNQLDVFITRKGSKEIVKSLGYSDAFMSNLGLYWDNWLFGGIK
jgi:hypothetical protein